MTDLVAFADWVLSAELPEDDMQLHKDFRAVFVDGEATPQQARRTLATLFHWGGLWSSTIRLSANGTIDPLALAGKAATSDFCKTILSTITQIPSMETPPDEEMEV